MDNVVAAACGLVSNVSHKVAEAMNPQEPPCAESADLDHPVKWAFIRLHPDDFERLVDTTRLVPVVTRRLCRAGVKPGASARSA